MTDPLEEANEVYRRYAAITGMLDPENGLGGQLLYADELSASSIRLVRAANIAGAASFIVSADAAALRQAMREGVVDFVVTTLDEALRILKNEIRKKQPVSVAIHCAEIAAFNDEMRERGVQPDLQTVEPSLLEEAFEWMTIALPAGDASFAAKLDVVVLDALPAARIAERRWYRQSPRYLPRQLRSMRTIACDPNAAAQIQSWYEQATEARAPAS